MRELKLKTRTMCFGNISQSCQQIYHQRQTESILCLILPGTVSPSLVIFCELRTCSNVMSSMYIRVLVYCSHSSDSLGAKLKYLILQRQFSASWLRIDSRLGSGRVAINQMTAGGLSDAPAESSSGSHPKNFSHSE